MLIKNVSAFKKIAVYIATTKDTDEQIDGNTDLVKSLYRLWHRILVQTNDRTTKDTLCCTKYGTTNINVPSIQNWLIALLIKQAKYIRRVN